MTANASHQDPRVERPARPPWTDDVPFTISQTQNPAWRWGDGASRRVSGSDKQHISIDPQDDARSASDNYKLLISGIIPRPIGFVSTHDEDGGTQNLAPMSYFQVVNHDPPVFVIGFAGGTAKLKDSLRNIITTKECVINIISEHFLEAANAASIDAPYGVSEWLLTGLTQAQCEVVRASRVKESLFSVETVLMEIKEFESRKHPGRKEGAMAVLEGVRFWVREDAMTAKGTIDPAVLRPVSRLGGMNYGRLTQAVELVRPVFEKDLSDQDRERLLGGGVAGT